MRSIRACAWVFVSALSTVVVACGGTSFSGIDTPAPDSGAASDGATPLGDGSSGVDSSAQSDAGGVTDTGSTVDSATPSDSSTRPETGTGCPDVNGRYEQLTAVGAGCGDLDVTAPQCIKGTLVACAAHFISAPPNTVFPAVNGTADLQADGTFKGAALTFGTKNRTGCTGVWTAATLTMTVTCGGASSSQSCVVSMVRAGACP